MNIVDMHCDTLSKLYQAKQERKPLALVENLLDIDLKRMKQAGSLCQNFAVFLDLAETDTPYHQAMEMIDLFEEEMAKNDSLIRQARSYQDMIQNRESGRMSALLTLEEGETCEGSIEKLHAFYDRGVRMMTLSWNHKNTLGYPNVDADTKTFYTPDTVHGLTEKGILFVEEMQKMGMIVDVSHMSDAGFYDVLKHTKKPFVASHSNARAVCPWVRNMTDDMIRRLAEKGGVMGLNFCMDFLIDTKGGERKTNYMEAVAKHASHIINVGGEECLGLGSDFDGIKRNEDLRGVETLPDLAKHFLKAGLSERQVDKIFSQNVLRVYKELL